MWTGSYIPSHRMDNVNCPLWSTQVMNGSGNAQEFKADISQNRRRYLLCLQKQQKKLFADSGLKAEEIDLILVAILLSETVFPNTSCEVQKAIGAVHAMVTI